MDMSVAGNLITIHIQVIWAVLSLVLAGLLLMYAGQSRRQ
jgi:hypothetical protein